MQDFRKLRVWQRAQELCVEMYLLSGDFPPEERFGMIENLCQRILEEDETDD